MDRIWAPWRYEYFEQPKTDGCFICKAIEARPEEDRQYLVLERNVKSLIMLNRYPYTAGALMVAPLVHKARIDDLDDETLLDMLRSVRQGKQILDDALHPKGYNIGINEGIEAGAGLQDHLHIHIVPRWGADTNFMTTIAETRVLSEALDHMYDRLRAASS